MEQTVGKVYPVKKPKPKKKKTINDNKLKEFVGPVDNLYDIAATNVFDNRYRIDVWISKYSSKESIAPSFRIEKSFFVVLTDDGESVDRTIQPKPRDKRII